MDSISLQPFLFVPFDSFLYSVDILGYSFMSLATLFAAFAFTGKGIERTVRWFMIANGLLLPFLALQIYYHPLIWIAALWAITFPGVTISRGLVSTKFGQIAEPTVALAYPSLSHLSSNSSVADGFNRAAAVVTTVDPGTERCHEEREHRDDHAKSGNVLVCFGVSRRRAIVVIEQRDRADLVPLERHRSRSRGRNLIWTVAFSPGSSATSRSATDSPFILTVRFRVVGRSPGFSTVARSAVSWPTRT